MNHELSILPLLDVRDLEGLVRLRLRHIADDGEDLVGDAQRSALRILLTEDERVLGHLHQPHGLVNVLLLHNVHDSKTGQRSGQSED